MPVTRQQVSDDIASKITSKTIAKSISNVDDGANRELILDYIDGQKTPYKVYTALLTQLGTNPPTVKILENTLGDNIIITYNSIGNYSLTLETLLYLFQYNKTFVIINGGILNPNAFVGVARFNDRELGISTTYNGSNSDNILSYSSLEIRVYN